MTSHFLYKRHDNRDDYQLTVLELSHSLVYFHLVGVKEGATFAFELGSLNHECCISSIQCIKLSSKLPECEILLCGLSWI